MNETIFLRAKAGEGKSFRLLYQQYQPVVFKMQKTYYLRELDQDDWYQEGQIIFHLSLQKYQAEKGLTFGCFFKMNLERHVVSLLRKQGALKRRSMMLSVSLEGELEAKGEYFLCQGKEQECEFSKKLILQDHLKDFGSHLSRFERQVFAAYLVGYSDSDISEQLQCSTGKIKNAMERIKRKFKQAIT